jgi:hypothetical protein
VTWSQKLDNIHACFQLLNSQGVRTTGISPEGKCVCVLNFTIFDAIMSVIMTITELWFFRRYRGQTTKYPTTISMFGDTFWGALNKLLRPQLHDTEFASQWHQFRPFSRLLCSWNFLNFQFFNSVILYYHSLSAINQLWNSKIWSRSDSNPVSCNWSFICVTSCNQISSSWF